MKSSEHVSDGEARLVLIRFMTKFWNNIPEFADLVFKLAVWSSVVAGVKALYGRYKDVELYCLMWFLAIVIFLRISKSVFEFLLPEMGDAANAFRCDRTKWRWLLLLLVSVFGGSLVWLSSLLTGAMLKAAWQALQPKSGLPDFVLRTVLFLFGGKS